MFDPLILDHVAIPSKGGAMENWGLILYQENSLLYDEEEEPISFKLRSASLIAHEVAHFWFGNLVTCEWWSDTWLNEGFAAFFQWEPLDDVLGWDKVNKINNKLKTYETISYIILYLNIKIASYATITSCNLY